jgi:hypothetical protein
MTGQPSEPPGPEDLQARIRQLAYAMWEAGGRQHGRALEYWLEAERRLLTMESDDIPPPPPRGKPSDRP